MNQRLHVFLNIPVHELIRNYEGVVDSVVATTADSRRIKFPDSILRWFVLNHDAHGTFELVFKKHFEFVSIRCIDG